MERYEMAELLSKKAGITLAEAQQALEENDWDILDAMVAIERSRQQAERTVVVEPSAPDGGSGGPDEATRPVKNVSEREPFFSNGFKTIWEYIKKLFRLLLDNDFVVIRKDKPLFRVPVLVLVALAVCCFWVVIPLLVIGLFCRCQYRFDGKQLGTEGVNRAMDKLGDMADNIREGFQNSAHDGTDEK